jgi:hypothetical protein
VTPPVSFCWTLAVAGWAALLLTTPAQVALSVGLLLLAAAVLTGFVQHVVAESRRDFTVSSSMLLLPVFAYIASTAGAVHGSVRTAAWAALVGAAGDLVRRSVRTVRRLSAARRGRKAGPVARRRRSGAATPVRRIEKGVPTGTCPSDSGDPTVERTDHFVRPAVPDPCGSARR